MSGAPDDDEDSGGVLLLRHCKEVFEACAYELLTPTRLVEQLCADEEWPWKTWRQGHHPITARGVTNLLKPFGIKSEKSGQRAYHRKSFEEPWKRYL